MWVPFIALATGLVQTRHWTKLGCTWVEALCWECLEGLLRNFKQVAGLSMCVRSAQTTTRPGKEVSPRQFCIPLTPTLHFCFALYRRLCETAPVYNACGCGTLIVNTRLLFTNLCCADPYDFQSFESLVCYGVDRLWAVQHPLGTANNDHRVWEGLSISGGSLTACCFTVKGPQASADPTTPGSQQSLALGISLS